MMFPFEVYKKSKIYTDSSHWLVIVPRPNKRAFKPKVEKEYNVLADGRYVLADMTDGSVEVVRKTCLTDEFDTAFNASRGLPSDIAFGAMRDAVRPFFHHDDDAEAYVNVKLANKRRAQEARSTRFKRKAHLNRFDFYCTFTYDDKKCTFEQFDRELRVFFNNKACRNGWRVMFVPEWGKKSERYHIHALIHVEDPTSIPGDWKIERRYSEKKRRMVECLDNTYFRDRWGMNDWQCLAEMSPMERKNAVGYIIKYLTKTDARAFYSRGIPTFLQADIKAKDVIQYIYRKDCTGILFDDFHLYDGGKDLGVYTDKLFSLLAITG